MTIEADQTSIEFPSNVFAHTIFDFDSAQENGWNGGECRKHNTKLLFHYVAHKNKVIIKYNWTPITHCRGTNDINKRINYRPKKKNGHGGLFASHSPFINSSLIARAFGKQQQQQQRKTTPDPETLGE